MNGQPDVQHGPFTGHVDPSFGGLLPPATTASAQMPSTGAVKQLLKAGDRKKIKSLLRNSHWPADHEVRIELWPNVCTAVKQMRGSIYQDMVNDVFGEDGKYDVLLPSFVDPANMNHYHLSTAGVLTAKKVVCIIGKTRPDIAFGPTIFALSSLMLHYSQEENVYNCMEMLLDSKASYIVQTKIAYEASKHVLKELAKKYAKACYTYIAKSGVPIERVFDNWMWWILRDLPFSYLVRVIDCYLFEGPKILYRVALALLILFHRIKVKGGDQLDTDLAGAVAQFCEDTPGVTIDRLLKTAFGIRGLSRKEITKLIVKNEMYVKSISNSISKPYLPKSPSCESLDSKVKVSRTFSLQEVGPSLLEAQQLGGGSRSRSQGMVPFSKLQSDLLEGQDWDLIWQWIPPRITVMVPEKIFSTSDHGISLKTFFNKVEGYEPTLIVVKAVSGEVFGAYCSTDWEERHHHERNLAFIGTGETFIFSMRPEQKKFQWVGITLAEETPNSAQLFMSGDSSQINIGGGGGIAIHLDENLDDGRTEHCDTFANPPFVEGKDFKCAAVEVFTFQ